MLRKILDRQLEMTAKGKPLHWLRPLVSANDTFLYQAPYVTSGGPHIRNAIDIKRCMILVIIALIPCILMAIWNTGLQQFVYSSGDYHLMNEYLESRASFDQYFAFVSKEGRALTIVSEGLAIFLPLALIVYVVGGFWEVLFAILRRHEISEGFLVTGILIVLTLPPTIPLWMTAVGVSAGIVFGKEIFGGSGMNIVNPALACRSFLFFGFPGKMTGNIWVGSDPSVVRESLLKMNKEAGTTSLDGYTQATKLAEFNIPFDIKRIHVETIANNTTLTADQLKSFVTENLGLAPTFYEDATHFAHLNNGDWNLFFGDRIGSLGETSLLACLLGGLFLIYTRVASWRTMCGMALGAFLTAFLFEMGSKFGADGGAWNPAIFSMPAYKHFLWGGLTFGLVFMATDPVSSPSINLAKWVYGIFCGMVTIIIRLVNPAYPEGVMLAILMGNVFAPLFDHYAAILMRKRRPRVARAVQ